MIVLMLGCPAYGEHRRISSDGGYACGLFPGKGSGRWGGFKHFRREGVPVSKEYDPFMHTAEHVLNQTMVRMFGCGRSFSSHLNADKSKCDYHFLRPLEDAEAAELERRINEVLAQHMPVRTEMLPREEAGKLVDLGRLPAHLEGEEELMVRIVTVGDYDICPCIGGAC